MSDRKKTFDSNRDIYNTNSLKKVAEMEMIQQQIEALRVQAEEMARFRVEFGAQAFRQPVEDNHEDDDNDSLIDYHTETEPSYADMGKVPDIVKDLPKFDGNAHKFVQWMTDVQGIIDDFSRFKKTGQYQTVLKAIRRKIIGEADEILNTNGTQLSWREIRGTLSLHFSDKRDLMTLTNQLTHMTKKLDNIETFHAKIQEMHSLIINCVRMDPEFKAEGEIKGVIKIYSRMCLDTFIRGVGSPLSQFMRNYKPASLAQAYQYALEFQNTEFRTNLDIPSSIPQAMPRTYGNQQMYPQQNRNNFMPKQMSNQPKYFNPRQNYTAPAKPSYNAPEPMDIDRSIRTRQVNYSNKPLNQNDPKRGAIRQTQDTPSWRAAMPEQKRMAHIAQVEENNFNVYMNATEEQDEEEPNQNENFRFEQEDKKEL